MRQLLKFFSSLQLTVALLSLSMALIFFGTLDQVEYGIWHTQKLYFESFLAVWAYPEAWVGIRSTLLAAHTHARRLPARRPAAD